MIPLRSLVTAGAFVVTSSLALTSAYAQGPSPVLAADAGAHDTRSGSGDTMSVVPWVAPMASTATEEPAPRPVRGPSVRERGGRRSRGASTASGAMLLVMLIGALGYYVVKRLRR